MSRFLTIVAAVLFVASLRWPPLADMDKIIFPTMFAVLFLVGAATANARAS